jgi:type IV pilus assembly protein PilA
MPVAGDMMESKSVRRIASSVFVGAIGIYIIVSSIYHSINEYPYEQISGLAFFGAIFVVAAIRSFLVGRAKKVASVLIFLLPLVCVAELFMSSRGSYTKRATVTEGLSLASAAKTAIAEIYANTGTFPDSNVEAGLGPPNSFSGYSVSSIEVYPSGAITVTYGSEEIDRRLIDQTMLLVPSIDSGALSWDCRGGTLPAKYRPSSCR